MRNQTLILRHSIIYFLLIFVLQFPLLGQNVKLKFIETSDIHGALFPWDFINNVPKNTSLAQVYTYVQQERADKNQSVILLDNGDLMQGQPMVYYSNFEKVDQINISARVLNYMKYDAATVGNHDIETGHAVYDKVEQEFNFPYLAANAVENKTGEPYFKPYTILNRQGVKIAILGLITPSIPKWLPEDIWSGMHFTDMIESARKWVKIIKKQEKPDLLIGLFHSGVDPNYNGQNADMPLNENATQLVAEQVPGFDVVFAGHDHKSWNKSVVNTNGDKVLIMGPLSSARTVTEVSIIMNKNKKSDQWDKEISGNIIQIKDFIADEDFMNHFNADIEEVKNYVSKPIGRFTKTISTQESMFGDSPFVDLIHRIQLDLTKADVSFAAPLSFNTKIKKGQIFVRDMFNLYKFENLLYTMEMSGQEIKDYLEYSYGNWFNQMKSPDDHLLKFKKDENGMVVSSHGFPQLASSSYNFSSAAGIKYIVDVSKPAGNKITIVSMANDQAFNLKKSYKVALNSYRGNGGGGHLTEGAKIPKNEIQNRIISSTPKDLRYYLMKWIENEKIVTPKALENWEIIPHDWWVKGKLKDLKIMFK